MRTLATAQRLFVSETMPTYCERSLQACSCDSVHMLNAQANRVPKPWSASLAKATGMGSALRRSLARGRADSSSLSSVVASVASRQDKVGGAGQGRRCSEGGARAALARARGEPDTSSKRRAIGQPETFHRTLQSKRRGEDTSCPLVNSLLGQQDSESSFVQDYQPVSSPISHKSDRSPRLRGNKVLLDIASACPSFLWLVVRASV
jgi:hypothetical protein